MDTIDTNAWYIISRLLDRGAMLMNRRSSNQILLPNTNENRQLLVALLVDNDGEEHTEAELEVYQTPRGEKLIAYDWWLAGFFARMAREFAGRPELTPEEEMRDDEY